MKKFPNRCWNTKTKLEKIKRIYKRVFSGFYCFPNKTCVLRVNAKISFLELQLRKFNSFCSFFVCSISYRFYDYPEIFMKIRCSHQHHIVWAAGSEKFTTCSDFCTTKIFATRQGKMQVAIFTIPGIRFYNTDTTQDI